MIRQICPNCFQPVELPDSAAGTTVPCPKCQASFAVPGRYAPGVDPALSGDVPPPPGLSGAPIPAPPPPPGFVPPTAPATAAAADVVSPAGKVRRRGVTVNPAVLDWFPAGCFTLILLLTLFPWVGLYPGGYSAYTQSGLGAVFGNFTPDSFAEGRMQLQERGLSKAVHTNWIMVLYVLGLVAAVGLAWADRVVTRDGRPLPPLNPILDAVWASRFPVLAGLALGLLVLLLIQLWPGFGLETGVEQLVRGEQAAATAGQPDTEATRQAAVIEQGMKLGRYQIRTTLWLGLAIGTHVVAVAAAGLRLWLYRRGPKPLPRVVWEA